MSIADMDREWRARANAAAMFWRCTTTLRSLRESGEADSEARAEHRQMLQVYAFFSSAIPFVGDQLRRQSAAELAADEEFYGEGPNSAWLWDFDEPEKPSEPLPKRRKRKP